MCDASVEREPKACAVEIITVETATQTTDSDYLTTTNPSADGISSALTSITALQKSGWYWYGESYAYSNETSFLLCPPAKRRRLRLSSP